MRRDPGSSLLRRCPAARAASIATRRSSDAMLARNVSYVSCTSWPRPRRDPAGTRRSSLHGLESVSDASLAEDAVANESVAHHILQQQHNLRAGSMRVTIIVSEYL